MNVKKSKSLKVLSFWAINDALELPKLKGQLLEMKVLGFDGVVFHPRNYPGNPEYLSEAYMQIVSDLILYVKTIQMRFWMYDENGWPSGTASGKVLDAYPESKCYWIESGDYQIKNCGEFI